MTEPLDEAAEVSWLLHLDRFEQHIYPAIFEKRGYSKGEALIVWGLSKVETSVDELSERIQGAA